MSALKLKSSTNTATLKFSGDFDRELDPANGQIMAWVGFIGVGTVTMQNAGNVSSLIDNGTGDYTLNFTNSLPDNNYIGAGSTSYIESGSDSSAPRFQDVTISSCRVECWGNGSKKDSGRMAVVIIH